jgi:hypothetical protein
MAVAESNQSPNTVDKWDGVGKQSLCGLSNICRKLTHGLLIVSVETVQVLHPLVAIGPPRRSR